MKSLELNFHFMGVTCFFSILQNEIWMFPFCGLDWELALFMTRSGVLSGSIFSFACWQRVLSRYLVLFAIFGNANMCLCISWFWKQWYNIIIRIYILTMIETVSCPLFLHKDAMGWKFQKLG